MQYGEHILENLPTPALDYFSDYAWLHKSMAKLQKCPITASAIKITAAVMK